MKTVRFVMERRISVSSGSPGLMGTRPTTFPKPAEGGKRADCREPETYPCSWAFNVWSRVCAKLLETVVVCGESIDTRGRSIINERMHMIPNLSRCAALSVVLSGFLWGSLPTYAGFERNMEGGEPEKRDILLEAYEQQQAGAAPLLEAALDDDALVVRRTAVRLLGRLGEAGRNGLAKALLNPDPAVRSAAIDALAAQGWIQDYWAIVLLDNHPAIQRDIHLKWLPEHPLPEGEEYDLLMSTFSEAFDIAAPSERLHIVNLVAGLDPLNETGRAILLRAATDEDADIRTVAFWALLKYVTGEWPEAPALLTAAQEDELESVQSVGRELRWKLLEVEPFPLPFGGWRFALDEDDRGEEAGWFAVEFDDSAWRDDVAIAENWQDFLDDDYVGVGWYRITVDLPGFEGWDKAYLDFQAVDESARVWMNGEFVGEHDIGPDGWDVPFVFEVTDRIRPGRENQITVKAWNTRSAGGITRPASLRVIDSSALETD